mmetsp:Transcript_91425/g.147656  ORF Transcript_91425/g.147656 Transcript_91425/m.147656 type:complete len:347 (-) Transcript_91425:513-1553(-)
MINVATPAPVLRSKSQQNCATAVFSTTMLFKPPHAVVIATSYLSSMAPKSPRRPWMPTILPDFFASISTLSTALVDLLACCELFESSSWLRIFLTPSRSAASFSPSADSSVLASSACFSVLASSVCFSLSVLCFSLRLGSASLSNCCALASASLALVALLMTSSISPLTRSQLLCASLLALVHGTNSSCALSSLARSASVSSLVASYILSSTWFSVGMSFSIFAIVASASTMAFSCLGMDSFAFSAFSCSLTTVSLSFLSLVFKCLISSLNLISLRSNTENSAFVLSISAAMASYPSFSFVYSPVMPSTCLLISANFSFSCVSFSSSFVFFSVCSPSSLPVSLRCS